MNKNFSITIIANAALGSLLSGGDNIFIECARRWQKMGSRIHIFVWEEGLAMCKRRNLTGVNYILWPSARLKKFGFLVLYIGRTVIGTMGAFRCNLESSDIVYSASDFWPDAIPAVIMKMRKRRLKWVAGFFLFAPKPWQKDSPYKGKQFVTGFLYWFTQLPVFWIVRRYADMVFVTSEPDVHKFVTRKRAADKIIVIRGGVDIVPSERYLHSGDFMPVEKRKYDACFIGRFHYQKGVLELIDIWKRVTRRRPGAKLAIIGSGPLEEEVKAKIRDFGLGNAIELLGFREGEKKYEIFKQSKLVVHPAIYDSGGMAAAEAMAWGLPGVSFDLEALKSYYPKGMLKTKCFDLQGFADNVIRLLSDTELYGMLCQEALSLVREEWDWDKRAMSIYGRMTGVTILR